MERHFCVTVYIFNKETEKFVFIRHKKLQKWFPPGGHIDPNESPTESAKREVLEETGLYNIEFINAHRDIIGASDLLIQPFGIQANKIKDDHEHLDLIYLATTKNGSMKLNQAETDGIAEFSLDEILDDKFDTLENQRCWCKYFINYINTKQL